MLEIVLTLIVLHGPDGREIDVNKDEITSLQCKIPGVENRLYAEGVNAVISLTDGKHVSVRETCAEIRQRLQEQGDERHPDLYRHFALAGFS